LANLSSWPPEKIGTFRRLLRDETLVSPHDLLTTQKILPHGHVEALLLAVRKLGLDAMISSQPCRERDLVLAMIVQRLLDPCSKLATTRQWHSTTLAEELGGERGPRRRVVWLPQAEIVRKRNTSLILRMDKAFWGIGSLLLPEEKPVAGCPAPHSAPA
jgi:hypothetical protein